MTKCEPADVQSDTARVTTKLKKKFTIFFQDHRMKREMGKVRFSDANRIPKHVLKTTSSLGVSGVCMTLTHGQSYYSVNGTKTDFFW